MNRIEQYFADQKDRLLGYINSRLRSGGSRDAEDLLQDVMLGILERITPGDDIANLGGYVYRSIRNRIIDGYRKKESLVSLDIETGEERSVLLDMMTDLRYDAHDATERALLRERIFAAVDALPADMRSVWCAVVLESHTFQDLSLRWGVPIGTLLSRKHRADLKLREILSDLKSVSTE